MRKYKNGIIVLLFTVLILAIRVSASAFSRAYSFDIKSSVTSSAFALANKKQQPQSLVKVIRIMDL